MGDLPGVFLQGDRICSGAVNIGQPEFVFLSLQQKKPSSLFKRDESLNFRGTTLIGIKNARFRHRSGLPDESRLSGNGEESRFRLSRAAASAEILEGQ